MLCYVDDVLSIIDDTTRTMEYIRSKRILKEDKVEDSGMYLGTEIYNINGVEFFSLYYEKYVTAAVKSVERNLAKNNSILTSKCKNLFLADYFPELDVTTELKANGV